MRSGVRLAPSVPEGLARSAMIFGAATVVALFAYRIVGPASRERAIEVRDAPYGPTMPFGLVQFVGQAAMLAGGVYVGRRWLRVRL